MSLTLNQFDTSDFDFDLRLNTILSVAKNNTSVEQSVREIITRVRSEGDKALLDYTQHFQNITASDVVALKISSERMKEASAEVSDEVLKSLHLAIKRITRYAQEQVIEEWQIKDSDKNMMGQKVTPLDSAGLYVPGGKAIYPSSLMMMAIPAKVAGVSRVVVVVPAMNGKISPIILTAAHLCEVDELYTIGGAQAIAALAYGTETIKPVDKIVGPGNQYVTEAKRQVFGTVGIDMLAGPSEIIILCDGSAPADWIAADLLSQAEHDEQARAILVSPDAEFIGLVAEAIQKQVKSAPRADIIKQSLQHYSALLHVQNLEEGVEVVNRIAPEHLMLVVKDAPALVNKIRHAGAIFLGQYTPEVFGDYCAGPNHVLPTNSAARFSSSLGVYDFQKRTSIIQFSQQGASKLAATAETLAECEGLFSHAYSAACRQTK